MKMIVLFVLAWVGVVTSFATGAPESACESMMPNHQSTAAQSGQSPFKIQVSAPSEKCKSHFKVTLTGTSTFRGFLCQPRTALNSSQTYGTFSALGDSSLMKDVCPSATGLTHTSNKVKTSVQFEWAPVGLESVYIVCTFVQEFDKIWHMQASERVIPNQPDPTCATTKPETTTTRSTSPATAVRVPTTKAPHAGATRFVSSTLVILTAVIAMYLIKDE